MGSLGKGVTDREYNKGKRGNTMRRLAIILAVLGLTLYLTEITAFAQRGHGRGGRVRDMPRMRGGREHRPQGRIKRGTAASRSRGSRGGVEITGRKSLNDRLSRNDKLSGRLQGLLGDRNLQESAEGFKNLGQFTAAVHVSKNLGIDFNELKTRMTESSSESLGTSENLGTSESLGKAIRALRPDVNANKEVRKANKQASKDLDQTSQ